MGSGTSISIKHNAQTCGFITAFIGLTKIAIIAGGASHWIFEVPFGVDDALAYLAYVCVFAISFTHIDTVEIGDKYG